MENVVLKLLKHLYKILNYFMFAHFINNLAIGKRLSKISSLIFENSKMMHKICFSWKNSVHVKYLLINNYYMEIKSYEIESLFLIKSPKLKLLASLYYFQQKQLLALLYYDLFNFLFVWYSSKISHCSLGVKYLSNYQIRIVF